ncbi:unnamed protein product [Polarella glacialis]|uniref:Reverse transcriptase domain-containing protein n=1 Tax=Polarella glacialis TaxID=89957 RepID=A0A813HGW1_POLGL|nr:unnamed protein product [Polarella glacialis]
MIKWSAKADRQKWLEQMIQSGDWDSVKKLRKGTVHRQGRLRTQSGILAESCGRAETIAKYHAQVQWRALLANAALPTEPTLGPTLPICVDIFSAPELHVVLAHLRCQRAAGHDDVPPEFWKILAASVEATTHLLELCSSVWIDKDIPPEWRHAVVTAVFRQGHEALPENYRPISLLTVGYKVLAPLLLNRLRHGGCEQRLRRSQFGFRPDRRASDAIFIAQRLIDTALAERDGKLSMIWLDWAKAFDRIDHAAMVVAVKRFGLPSEFVCLVTAIYRERTFVVREGHCESTAHRQDSGIAQGFPLSPYLFIIVLSVIFADVDAKIAADHRAQQFLREVTVTTDLS